MTDAAKYNVVFVLGGPGAGKGTQCDKIVKEFGFVHLSAGDLLRAERKDPNSEFGEEIEKHIKNGSIVPVAITCSLLKRQMEKAKEQNKDYFLIDGFPRNQDNLDGWNTQMSSQVNLKTVLFFDCPEEICVDRCLERGKTSGREDDNIESLKKRIQTYTECTIQVLDYYSKLGLVSKVSAERSPEEVFKDVKSIITKVME